MPQAVLSLLSTAQAFDSCTSLAGLLQRSLSGVAASTTRCSLFGCTSIGTGSGKPARNRVFTGCTGSNQQSLKPHSHPLLNLDPLAQPRLVQSCSKDIQSGQYLRSRTEEVDSEDVDSNVGPLQKYSSISFSLSTPRFNKPL